MSDVVTDPRPTPLRDAFKSVAAFVAVAGSLITAAVGWGLLTATQGDALQGLLGAVPGVVTLITALLGAFGVVRKAEPLVTPTSSPAVEAVDDDGNVVLVPLVPATELG